MKRTFECEATIENLEKVMGFVEGELEALECDMARIMQISLAVEEVYVNIAHYAYSKLDEEGKTIPDTGTGPMELDLEADEGQVFLTFKDEGLPYNPLEREDPDTTLSVEDREIGGLGIFMVKKSMDEVSYRHKEGKNILTLMKRI
ncbi:Anti-sigma regulatory factor (Ser/Thr protein kinase) [Pseudobutyrivibrio sp. 49]|uniref:ATP-binding protein n=1 Tax=unclassified Pseudobutyrivibrio TaxID=2638619 RepID=UPI000888F1D0|nr:MULTISPECIES: ATP-binding protein [unclassified Pseudobutyrivibrio]SDH79461.1 Anti-sigma regulatory factor (Ser/Thr protein kinase) [Pseudobutyrivibrio sp. 49]SFO01879.1 Anti-sigma regulatory factor (Ser/Thr protein kinase) [Pseudobutyrivibrio sp. UC1225]